MIYDVIVLHVSDYEMMMSSVLADYGSLYHGQ